jgi:hypothetical protein
MKKIIKLFIVFIFWDTNFTFAQELMLSGYVFGNSENKPLPYATIFVSNKQNIGTFSNDEGFFSLKVNIKDTLLISHVGYESVKLTAKNFDTQIILKSSVKYLKEITIKSKKNKTISKKLGLYWSKSEVLSFYCNFDNFALFIKNPLPKEGRVKSIYYKLRHTKDKQFINNKIQLRIRIYSIDRLNNQPDKDILNENIFISIRQNQNNVHIDLEKYNIPFLREGVFTGLDVIGYTDKQGKIIEGSSPQCRKNLCLKVTDSADKLLTYSKYFSKLKWSSISNVPKPKSKELLMMNVMFGAEIEFFEDE